MSETLPVVRESAELAERPASLLEVIARAATDPRVDIEKMERLLAMQREVIADERKVAFDSAMTRLQAKIPPMPKFGQGKNSKFAKYEDIARVIKPLLRDEGFSLSFSEDEQKDGKVRFSLEVSREGHSKFFYRTYSTDVASKNREGNSIRPAIQDDGSTTQYARRGLLKMALDIVETDDDTDGNDETLISDDQVKTIDTLIADTKSDKAKFLKLIAGVEKIADIQARDYKRVINALETKRRSQ